MSFLASLFNSVLAGVMAMTSHINGTAPTSTTPQMPVIHTVQDPFYIYTGNTPLSAIPLGTVLKERTVNYHVLGISTYVKTIQLLYRTNNALNQPVVNVTSIIKSPNSDGTKVISYQSLYDSLDPNDEPSQVIAGNKNLTSIVQKGQFLYNAESNLLAAIVQAGYDVIIPDTEGQTADFAAGPEYGMTTLDSIRATVNASTITGVNKASKIVLMGYSGGAIATAWAASLGPTYAPDVNAQLVGATFGGLLVDPAHNLTYINGSVKWGGVAAMALTGLARAYGANFMPYFTSSGVKVVENLYNKGILYVFKNYLQFQWPTMFNPPYGSNINSLPLYINLINQVNLGLRGSPSIPILYLQGTNGNPDGTYNPGIGDGAMLATDARTLVQKYCASGIPVIYHETLLDHLQTFSIWATSAVPWVTGRFNGTQATDDCAYVNVLQGTPLAPETIH